MSDARGAAVPLAVLALLVIGVLLSSAFLLGRQELAMGRSTLSLHEALAAAEGGLDAQVAVWDPASMSAMAVGDSMAFGGTLPGGGWYQGATRRLNDLLFLARSEGFSRDSGARHEVGSILRLDPVEVPRTAAFVTRGPIMVADAATIDGANAVPPGWSDCDPAAPPVAGLHVRDSAALSTAGCGTASCVAGSPAVLVDPSLDSSAAGVLSGAAFDDLASRATVTVSGGTRLPGPSLIGGVCNVLDGDNWGSPASPGGPCGSRFPLIWSSAGLTLTGGEGQGVLVVNGDLTLGGGFGFTGVVIVRGRLATVGAGGSVHGIVLADNVAGPAHEVGANAAIRYSSCAVQRALLGSALPVPIRSRGWIGLQ